MTVGHIEYTYDAIAPPLWHMPRAYTVTVLAPPNDRSTALGLVKKWVGENSNRPANVFGFTLRNADLPCYEEDGPYID